MRSEVERIQSQLRRAFEGKAWHGPALLELLADVDAPKAAARPIGGAHSIWELVLHIAAWDKAVANRLDGGRGEVSDEENFPVVNDTSEASWQKTIETLKENHRVEVPWVDQSNLSLYTLKAAAKSAWDTAKNGKKT